MKGGKKNEKCIQNSNKRRDIFWQHPAQGE